MRGGIFIYGPQALVGTVVANLATKQVAATAIGFTGVFAYASTLISGWGLGALVQHYGWEAGLAGLTGMAAIGMILFAFAWPAQAHGYGENHSRNDTRPRMLFPANLRMTNHANCH